jgi:hypothetical protein
MEIKIGSLPKTQSTLTTEATMMGLLTFQNFYQIDSVVA